MAKISFVCGNCESSCLAHNNREFISKNVNGDLSYKNINYVMTDPVRAYHILFDKSVSDYNSKQKRSDRHKSVDDYYKSISENPKQKLYYEIIIQIGKECDTDKSKYSEILNEYMMNFQERNPNFRVFNANLHMDEATPHLHICFIPVKHSKRGLSLQNSLSVACDEMGFKTQDWSNTGYKLWKENERDYLANLSINRGVNIDAPSFSGREYLSPNEFKKVMDDIQSKYSLDDRISAAAYAPEINNAFKYVLSHIPSENRKEVLSRFGLSDVINDKGEIEIEPEISR